MPLVSICLLLVLSLASCTVTRRDYGAGTGGAGGDRMSDGLGGDGGALLPVESDPGIGTLGEPCSLDGALACAGHAQRIKLMCTDGKWADNGDCDNGTYCDTSAANRGLCEVIVPECAGKPGGAMVCRDSQLIECGVDLVSATQLATCDTCLNGACYCPPGTAISKDDGSQCEPCHPGTYSASENAKQCARCPLGTVSLDENADACAPAQVDARRVTCALLTNGTVRCWGEGRYGQLGYGNTDDVGKDEHPVSATVVDVGGTVAQIASGELHTCALLTNGKVRCWGRNSAGQLGYGHTHDIGDDELPSSAGDVPVGGTVTQIAAGTHFTCALLSDGNVRCWGGNTKGRLGYGHTDPIGDDETPAATGNVDVGGTVVQLTTGSSHVCALLTTGQVRCWGDGGFGRLGYANTKHIGDDETPASAGDVDVGGTVVQVTAGGMHTCALLSNGNVRCWGLNMYGQLGYGHTRDIGDDEAPANASYVDVGGKVAQISAGMHHTCALLGTNVRCWGHGGHGRLGYGNTHHLGDDKLPTSAGDVSLGGAATQITAGNSHTCALLTNGNIRCWGDGSNGRLGYGNNTNVLKPTDAGDIWFQ